MSDLPQPTGSTPPSGSPIPPPPPPTYVGAPPPGYVGYHTNPAADRAMAIGGLAQAITVLLTVGVASNLIALVVTLGERSRFVDYLAGDTSISSDDVINAAGRISLASLPASAAFVATAVLTMIWMYRAAVNHRALGRPGSTWSPLWGVFGWFVPPVLFVIPWLMLGELWRGSAPGTVANDPGWKRNPISPLVHAWWVVFGLGGVFAYTAQLGSVRTGSSARDVAERFDASIATLAVSTALSVAGGILFLLVVRGLTARQQALLGR